MVLGVAQPWRHPESSIHYFRERIPKQFLQRKDETPFGNAGHARLPSCGRDSPAPPSRLPARENRAAYLK
jgi:hypothetical protein